MRKVFIDGSAGTTGLRIAERLSERKDITLIKLTEELRKDNAARREAINSADIVFLCLPDAASIEAVSFVENPDTVVIDTSTAHRVNPEWVYGFPEIGGRRELIRTSKRIANPGCHAGGFIALVAPLIENKVLSPDVKLSCFSLTGYSGGGKKMIAEYEAEQVDPFYSAPRQYGIAQKHKHLPEMSFISGLTSNPIFSPIVAPFYSGMEVTVPIFMEDLSCDFESLKTIYKEYYSSGLVYFKEDSDENGYLSASKLSGFDNMEISVFGNENRALLVSRFDNLGKGASGSAIQNMNIVLGIPEDTGLNV